MMVMPANHSAPLVHYAAGKYPGRIGWLIGPSSLPKTKLVPWMPFALDNDAFSAWSNGHEWDVEAWRLMLRKINATNKVPLWALVPDVVADRSATLERWNRFAPEVMAYGWQLAFACQDGMSPDDVPVSADIIFIGGTTEWKWKSLPMWVDHFQRVHVGRVNSLEKLWILERLKVESCDGTGWFRDTAQGIKARKLEAWLRHESDPQAQLVFAAMNRADEERGAEL